MAVLVLIYFASFPEDLGPIAAPLALTREISPWLYGLGMVAAVSWAAVRIGSPGVASRPAVLTTPTRSERREPEAGRIDVA